MFRFAHSEYLYLLFFLPIIIVLVWFTLRKQNQLLDKFANKTLHKTLFPLRSKFKLFIKSSLIVLAIGFLILALANPQIGSKVEEVKQVGIDVYILLDVSLSMKAEDIKPSRLDKAKHEIAQLIHRLQGDRIGLIVFSGAAYVQFPLTTDYAAANLFLSAVSVNSVPQPGTAIGPAVQLALNSFKKDEETQKAIVIITDGEDHEGELDKVIEEANNLGVKIYAIGLGSPKGVPIPVYNTAGRQMGYKKDRTGNVVLTKLDETTLKDITSKANGKYYRGSNTNDELEMIYNDLASMEGTEFGATKITEYEDRYYYFLIPAIFFLIFELLIKESKSKFFSKFEKN
ncbi:MAG: hypothetical protein CR986_03850 [Ignavibacteriae bacterium]|nr:MAG: hypothetical protein CR986_03850 [Ignavibacteriota bacterium]